MANQVIHHVLFWLKNPASDFDLQHLLEGLETLRGIECISTMYIGTPAPTQKRAVVDDTYSASELLIFNDLNSQQIYQDHPIHLLFIKNYSHLWEKVLIYDVIET